MDPTTAAVGSACTPTDEYRRDFAGFDANEVNLESGNSDCPLEGVCMTYRFRGRVSCPYGQTEADMSPSGNAEQRCYVPASDGQLVAVPVQPQLVATRGTRGVYCSALCADAKGGRNDGRRYHECPGGYHCEPVAYFASSSQLNGSYCVRNDTPTEAALLPVGCDRRQQSCGDLGAEE
jgi:hypothetical protein